MMFSRSTRVQSLSLAIFLVLVILLPAMLLSRLGVVSNMDLGEVLRGNMAEKQCRVWNLGFLPVRVESTKSSCACAASDLDGKVIWPFWFVTARVTFKSPGNGHVGHFAGKLLLKVNRRQGIVSLPIEVEVRAGTQLTLEKVDFNPLKESVWDYAKVGVLFKNPNTKIKQVDFDHAELLLRVEGNTIFVRPRSTKNPLDSRTFSVSVFTENPTECIPFQVRISKIDGIVIDPSCFFWEKDKDIRTDEKSIAVRLANETQWIEVVQSASAAVDLKLIQKTRKEYQLRCKMRPGFPQSPGYFSEKIYLKLLPENILIPIVVAGAFE